ncbi:MAG: hypothetical protein QNJ16_20390 [Rhodobacter sp.]|nr:hypothetical protein [Rhodobacter sp.]
MVIAIGGGGDGSGHLVTERFGPYQSESECTQAANVLEDPISEAGPFRAGFVAFCVANRN